MPANSFTTAVAVGNREDLVDVIYNTAPTDTPLISAIDKNKAEAVTHEWQRDILATPANNAVAEGADASYIAVIPTQRLSNQCQISRKSFSITDTQEKVNKAGRSSDILMQKVKQGKELRKDMELALIENPVLVTGTTRQLRGVRGWLQTNNDLGGGGVAPNPLTNTGPTDGTLRPLTEGLVRTAVLGAFTNGGNPSMLMVPPSQKQVISASFTGNGTKYIKAETRQLEAAYDIYHSDFGIFKIVPNRVMQRKREAYLIDPDMMALSVLREINTTELARIGSARNFMLEAEYTLEMREERASGAVRDLS